MVFLLLFIIIGFLLSKCKIVPDGASKTISILENYVFVPGLVLYTFIDKCTIETLSGVWKLVVLAFVMVLTLIECIVVESKETIRLVFIGGLERIEQIVNKNAA